MEENIEKIKKNSRIIAIISLIFFLFIFSIIGLIVIFGLVIPNYNMKKVNEAKSIILKAVIEDKNGDLLLEEIEKYRLEHGYYPKKRYAVNLVEAVDLSEISQVGQEVLKNIENTCIEGIFKDNCLEVDFFDETDESLYGKNKFLLNISYKDDVSSTIACSVEIYILKYGDSSRSNGEFVGNGWSYEKRSYCF